MNPITNKIVLKGSYNTRHLGSYATFNTKNTRKNTYIRSDSLSKITEDDIQKLLNIRAHCIIDLRYEKEFDKNPNPLKNNENFKYYSIPIFPESIMPKLSHLKEVDMGELYIDTLKNYKYSFLKIFRTMSKQTSNILFHCTAGKDRTGIISCILLMLVGVPTQTIVLDYCLSEKLLSPIIDDLKKDLAKSNGELFAASIYSAKEEYILKLINFIKSEYSSAYNYLKQLGLTDYEIVVLKNKLV